MGVSVYIALAHCIRKKVMPLRDRFVCHYVHKAMIYFTVWLYLIRCTPGSPIKVFFLFLFAACGKGLPKKRLGAGRSIG